MICQSLQFYWGARVHEDFKKHGWPAGGLPLGLLELHAVDITDQISVRIYCVKLFEVK